MNEHEFVQEQVVLWLLGYPMEGQISVIVDHLSQCEGCRDALAQAEMALGALPEVLPVRTLPGKLRQTIMKQIEEGRGAVSAVSPDGSELEDQGYKDSDIQVTAGRKVGESKGAGFGFMTGWLRGVMKPIVVGLLFALAVTNLTLLRKSALSELEATRLADRYHADMRWLKTAESFLVQDTKPVVRVDLVPREVHASGRAALYKAYQDTYYLIVHVSSLEPDAPYNIWLELNGDKILLGDLVTSPDGVQTWVYRSVEKMLSGRLEIYPGGIGKPALVGYLQ